MYEFPRDHDPEIRTGPDADVDLTSDDGVAAPASVPRSRLSRLLLIGLVLSVAVLVGSAVVSRRSDTERRDAADRHVLVVADLETQRTRSSASDSSLSAATEASVAYLAAGSGALATARQATSSIDEELAIAQQQQAAGLAGNVDDYNAAVARANAALDRDDAIAAQLSSQLDALPGATP